MSIYYVNIPIYISKDAPERTRTANLRSAVAIEARSEMEALVKFSDALTEMIQRGTPPPVSGNVG